MSTDYSKLSDQHINALVAEITGNHGVKVREWGLEQVSPDYCNDPAEAWPIIVKSKITIEFGENICPELSGSVSASRFDNEGKLLAFDVNTESYSPLRAAMIVFLMMQEASNAKSA